MHVWPNLMYGFAHLQLSITKTECKNHEHVSREKSSSHILDLGGQILCTNLEQKEYWMGMTGSSSLCLLSYYTLAEPWELVWHLGDISPSLRRKKKRNEKKSDAAQRRTLCIHLYTVVRKGRSGNRAKSQAQAFLK